MAIKKLKTKITRLETIAASLDDMDMELEKSMALFEEGMKLINECHGDLDKAESKVMLLTKDGTEEAYTVERNENGV